MPTQQAYRGEITLAFQYVPQTGAAVQQYDIPSERISYVMIEHLYENQHVLPVIYVSLNLTSDLYDKVMSTMENSKFYLRIRKKDGLSNTSVYKKVVEDIFTYVSSTTALNYADNLDNGSPNAYKNIMLGLVSSSMTNTLRTSYNGIYRNIDTNGLVDLALKDIGKVIKAPVKYNTSHTQFVIPPLTSRYRLLEYIFDLDPFYGCNFTFYMDFNKTYLIPKNGEAVSGGDGIDNVIINVKDYTDQEAYADGFTISNGAYVVYVNATDTKTIVNNASSKVTSNIVGYDDNYSDPQEFRVDTEDVTDNTSKVSYVRAEHAGMLKQDLESNSIMLELLKQNMDADVFVPNRSYNVSNYGDYRKYDGAYFLSYKREFYAISSGGEFKITSNVGLKKAGIEEAPLARKNALAKKSRAVSSSSKVSTSKSGNKTSSTPRNAGKKK